MAAVTARLMDRTGALLDVARQAAATEPTSRPPRRPAARTPGGSCTQFWRTQADDGLLPAGADLDWLGETATLLAQADTYLLLPRPDVGRRHLRGMAHHDLAPPRRMRSC